MGLFCYYSTGKALVSNSSDGRVIRTSASGAVDLLVPVGLIPSLVKRMTSKLAFTAFLLYAQH